MGGKSIQRSSECLELFIRSLPSPSYFNVICFGSQHKSLFTNSEPYNEQTATEVINLAQNLKADLGDTDIYTPLRAFKTTEFSQSASEEAAMRDSLRGWRTRLAARVTLYKKETTFVKK